MSAIVTLLSRNGRRSGTGRSVNSLGKKDVGRAADGVVAETLDVGTERNAATLCATRTSNQSAGIAGGDRKMPAIQGSESGDRTPLHPALFRID